MRNEEDDGPRGASGLYVAKIYFYGIMPARLTRSEPEMRGKI